MVLVSWQEYAEDSLLRERENQWGKEASEGREERRKEEKVDQQRKCMFSLKLRRKNPQPWNINDEAIGIFFFFFPLEQTSVIEHLTLFGEELGESDREAEVSYGIPYMWNLKRNDTNELTKQKQTHKLMIAGGKDGGKGQLGSLEWI